MLGTSAHVGSLAVCTWHHWAPGWIKTSYFQNDRNLSKSDSGVFEQLL